MSFGRGVNRAGGRSYPIRCYIDCDYKTSDRPGDVKRSFEFAKKALG